MTMRAIVQHTEPTIDLLLQGVTNKDQRSRLARFASWLDAKGAAWHVPNLTAYRDHLHSLGLSNASIAANLSSVRGRYGALLRSNVIRDELYGLTPADADPSNRKALVDELLIRLTNAIDPIHSPVTVIKVQDVADSAHVRLTSNQAQQLIDAPMNDAQNSPLQVLRDTALIALMLCTGIREMELCALDVNDLRQRFGGELALRVREGKGAKARMIPYGELSWCLTLVDRWLAVAEITEGVVFRGFYKGGKRVRETRLTERAVQDIIGAYCVYADGERIEVKPHDLRRSYARLLYDAGMQPVAIQQNMGHADLKTTLSYIGTLDAKQRRSPAAIKLPKALMLTA